MLLKTTWYDIIFLIKLKLVNNYFLIAFYEGVPHVKKNYKMIF